MEAVRLTASKHLLHLCTHAIAFRQKYLFIAQNDTRPKRISSSCTAYLVRIQFLFSVSQDRVFQAQLYPVQVKSWLQWDPTKQSRDRNQTLNLLRRNIEHLAFVCVTCEQSIHLWRCGLAMNWQPQCNKFLGKYQGAQEC